MSYRKYDPMIKKMIIESGNKNLFPELRIPRTTINYWLKSSKEPVSSGKNKIYDELIKKQGEEVFRLKAKNLFMKECFSKLLSQLDCFSSKSLKNKKKIVELVEDFKEFLSLKEILDILGLPPSTYYRWRTLVFGCEYNKKEKCLVVTPTSLTAEEQRKLIQYGQAREFKKFLTVSLMYYCRRKNLLNVSLESWYKYLRMYGVDRAFKKVKVKAYKRGLRSKRKNEIWHIDVTHLKYGNGITAYLQLIVDNDSRLIVGWSLSHDKTMNVTRKTLIKSFNFAPEFNGRLISDGGGENTGATPKNLLIGKGIKHLVAKSDIRFSNSMVKAVFRQFKQKFLTKKVDSFKGLYQRVYSFVKQYNIIIPHSSLGGATPIEVFQNRFDKDRFKEVLRKRIMDDRKKIRETFLNCVKCSKSYFRGQRVWS